MELYGEVCVPNFKGNFLFFLAFNGLVFNLETIEVRLIMIWWLAFEKKAISILAGNLNSGHSYLITAVLSFVSRHGLRWEYEKRTYENFTSKLWFVKIFACFNRIIFDKMLIVIN